MAEEEKIRQHAKHALQSLTDKEKEWKARLIDFAWEVFIIIVAVNITLWFHNYSDKRRERQQAKEFLIDIREDLVQDTVNIRNYINDMTNDFLVYYDSVLSQISRNKINAQYIDDNVDKLSTNNFNIAINLSKYQSFSSSGNLRLIENRQLLNDITYLYSEIFPKLPIVLSDLYNRRNDAFDKYIGYKIGMENNGMINVSTIINRPEIKYLFKSESANIKGINSGCEKIINKIDAVIPKIDNELKSRYNYEVKN